VIQLHAVYMCWRHDTVLTFHEIDILHLSRRADLSRKQNALADGRSKKQLLLFLPSIHDANFHLKRLCSAPHLCRNSKMLHISPHGKHEITRGRSAL
jgi:hypothetical protein